MFCQPRSLMALGITPVPSESTTSVRWNKSWPEARDSSRIRRTSSSFRYEEMTSHTIMAQPRKGYGSAYSISNWESNDFSGGQPHIWKSNEVRFNDLRKSIGLRTLARCRQELRCASVWRELQPANTR